MLVKIKVNMKAKMQSFLMTLFFACLCLNSNAQYHHFIESGKTWRELVEYSIGMWYIDEYQIYGDTTINSVSYKKIEMGGRHLWSHHIKR